jgi:hypothetical protein
MKSYWSLHTLSAMVPSVLALIADFVVLGAALLVWRNSNTRHVLRRQSLHLVLCMQVVDVLNNITYMWVAVDCRGCLY